MTSKPVIVLLFSLLLLASCKKPKSQPSVVPEETEVVKKYDHLTMYMYHSARILVLPGADSFVEHSFRIDFATLDSNGNIDSSYNVGTLSYAGVTFEEPADPYLPHDTWPYFAPFGMVIPETGEVRLTANEHFDDVIYQDNLPWPQVINFPDTFDKSEGLQLFMDNTAFGFVVLDMGNDVGPSDEFLVVSYTGNTVHVMLNDSLKTILPDSVFVRVVCSNRPTDNSYRIPVKHHEDVVYRKWLKVVD